MIDLTPYKYFYFLGIGGIGMSALARYFHSKGFEVAGYDKTRTELTDQLEKEGMFIHYDDDISRIPEHFLEHKDEFLTIITPAIPGDLTLDHFISQNDFRILKRSEALAAITYGKKTIAVGGTHGKTSTTAIISHILKTADIPFYGFLGGISVNYQTNYISPAEGEDANLAVVEADEYDRSFLRLNPDIAIVTAVETDHLDIYGTEQGVRE